MIAPMPSSSGISATTLHKCDLYITDKTCRWAESLRRQVHAQSGPRGLALLQRLLHAEAVSTSRNRGTC